MFVKVTCVEDQFPFYVDEFGLERFPLYWYSEPVQILGMSMVSRENLKVIEFLENHTTTGGLKNFFKNRSERGHSASNVIKTEEGVVEVKGFAEKQKKLHCYAGEEDLTSVWSEQFPFLVLEEENFQSKADFDLIGSVDGITRAQFMQVCAARLFCLGRYEELKATDEANQKKDKVADAQKLLELERELQVSGDQLSLKEKEIQGLKSDVEQLKGKLQKYDKEKTELEARVVELCVQKKDAEESKENHGYEMMEAGFEGARKQAEFLYPDFKFDQLDPIKVVHNGALVDDDEIDLEGGDDHNSE
ncbi:hypothetical protein PIB30_013156 [Stylosanthes scabra]|uniref:Uncharacterized protein n=1 Tax=Stylosanthes scabra TaxID=79078 RepID=A0ABU6Y360_9FABA|nr:hypothetical protein [Stylosanthes scabra]